MEPSQTSLTEEIRPLLGGIVSLYETCQDVCQGGVGCSVFISQVIHRPTVMLMGINPGKAKGHPDWEHVGEKHTVSLKSKVKKGDDKFLNLCKKCFTKADWDALFATEPYDIVWSNLYPIATNNVARLNRLFDKVRTDELHPKRICRETMAHIVLKVQPRILLCAGKGVYRDMCKALKEAGAGVRSTKQTVKGVYHCEAVKDGFVINIVGFNRASSVGFWYDCRNKNKNQEQRLKEITRSIIEG